MHGQDAGDLRERILRAAEAGGRWIEAEAPIEHSPLYVKAGSIIPFAVCQQFTGEQPDAPYTIKIYPGADADFEIYEDAGDGYAYEKKAFATYRLHWNDKAKTLEISARKGSYRNMVKERKLDIEATNGTNERLIYEASDMFYHLIVLLTSKGLRIEDIAKELQVRHDPNWHKH